MKPKAGDPYRLKNHVNLIDTPGEWALEPSGKGRWKIYFWLPQIGDFAKTQSRRTGGALISGMGIKNVRIEGLEVMGGQDDGISIGRGSQNVVISRCVVFAESA